MMSQQKNELEPVKIGVFIPHEVLQREGLTDREKIVLSAVYQLYKRSGECYASNPHLGRWLGISSKEISETVSNLTKKNWLKRRIVYKGKEVDKRYLIPNLRRMDIKKKQYRGTPRMGGGYPPKEVREREA
ncbi:MAG: helix-turn-helix domain-containing protein [Anaerohalosphaeraceae bacterium]